MKDTIYREDAIDAVKFYEAQCDPYPRVIESLQQLPSAEPETAHDIVDYARYQVEWLESHNDLELEPELEKWIVRMLNDTAECYIMEHPELKIIQCKDCINADYSGLGTERLYCMDLGVIMHSDDYCSRAERGKR